MTRHIKRYHNGKDRRTNRQIDTKRKVGKPAPLPTELCCETVEISEEVNWDLLMEMRAYPKGLVWDNDSEAWMAEIPARFAGAYQYHMNHFLVFAYRLGYRLAPVGLTSAQKQAINERLLKKLNPRDCDKVWDEREGKWWPQIPRWFANKYRAHMNHFRRFAHKFGFR